MDNKQKDADTERNTKTVAGPHALLTVIESLIHSRRMYTLLSHFTAAYHCTCTHKALFWSRSNWTSKSEHQET